MKNFFKILTPKGGEGKAIASAFYDDLACDVFARTLWGEGRGEGAYGMEAIASVVLNRVAVATQKGGSYWWGNNIISVCQKPYQFSCWNRSDPNYRKLQAVTDKDVFYATAIRIARRAINGALPDSIKGATHYHARSINPEWAKGQTPTAVIGNHIFYKLIEG